MLCATVESAVSPIQIMRRTSASATPWLAPVMKTQCSTCHVRDLCLPCGLEDSDVARLDGLLHGRRKVRTGQALYRDRDRFQFIYAVRSGTFKSAVTLLDGREQVTAFHMAGEVMGLDGVAYGAHASTAIALEDAEVCAIPYALLAELAAESSSLQHIVGRLMSREILREHSHMVMLGSMNAEERLAAFLLNVSQRLKSRGFSAREFHLRMSRAEIGSYLGMKLETVSRTFSAFQQIGILEVDKKHVRIVDIDALGAAFERREH